VRQFGIQLRWWADHEHIWVKGAFSIADSEILAVGLTRAAFQLGMQFTKDFSGNRTVRG
jgi:hypothetical protein